MAARPSICWRSTLFFLSIFLTFKNSVRLLNAHYDPPLHMARCEPGESENDDVISDVNAKWNVAQMVTYLIDYLIDYICK